MEEAGVGNGEWVMRRREAGVGRWKVSKEGRKGEGGDLGSRGIGARKAGCEEVGEKTGRNRRQRQAT